MDGFLRSDLPWQLKMLMLLTAGLILAVATLAIPERTIVYLGRRFTWWSPSVTSVGRVIIFWISLIFGYLMFSTFWGFLGVVEGCVLDVYDGRQATVYAKWNIFRTEREKRLGKTIDAGCDKGTVPPSLVYFGYMGSADLWLTTAIMFVDVLGTIVRHLGDIGDWLCKRNTRFQQLGIYLKEKHKAITRHEKATSIGKIKALMQCFALIACTPYHQGWLHGHLVADILCAFALILGVLSILSRLYIHKTVDEWVDWTTDKFFSHMNLRQIFSASIKIPQQPML